ncbi:MAG TPA: hypothetical protein VNG70_11320 [Candidatus Limnocylindria bacterium]|nr:hypothetical protein [Candidatus Limnocylindria bacterium]
MRPIRTLVLALALCVLPVAASIGVSAASPTVTHHKVLAHQVQPDSTCIQLTGHVGCYVESTETDTQANTASNIFVQSASAWTGCSGIYTYVQTYYSWTGLALAASSMKFAYCYDARAGVQVTWGPNCYVTTIIGYGGGVNYCSGNGYPNWPGWASESWYLYPYSAWWWHINNQQQVLIYPTWQSWSGCTAC